MPPPKSDASVNASTLRLFFGYTRRRLGSRRGLTRRRRLRRGGLSRRSLLLRGTFHDALRRRGDVMGKVGHGERQNEKQRRQNSSGVAQKIGRTAGTEYRAGGAAAEGRTCVRALALLHQDQHDQRDRDEHQNDFKNRIQH